MIKYLTSSNYNEVLSSLTPEAPTVYPASVVDETSHTPLSERLLAILNAGEILRASRAHSHDLDAEMRGNRSQIATQVDLAAHALHDQPDDPMRAWGFDIVDYGHLRNGLMERNAKRAADAAKKAAVKSPSVPPPGAEGDQSSSQPPLSGEGTIGGSK